MKDSVVSDKGKNSHLKMLRNMGFIAHIDAGKTTTTERILFYTGRLRRPGEVHEGTTVTDWMQQERERGITITSACTRCEWKDYDINIIDTPGHVDFTVEVERSLKVLDGAVVIFCAVGGVESQSETVWRQADKYRVPRICFVNKMDRVGADFYAVVKQVRSRLGVKACFLQIPMGQESEFRGVIDLVNMKEIFYRDDDNMGIDPVVQDVTDQNRDMAVHHREDLISYLGEIDEEILDLYIHSKHIDNAFLKNKIRELTIKNKFFPVFCGSALKNKGVQRLIDAVCDYLPSPLDVPAMQGTNSRTGQPEEISSSTSSTLCALCFKVATDPYVGRLNYVRIYSGKIKAGQTVVNTTVGEKEKVSKIVRMHANKQEMIDETSSGDIVALVGLKVTTTGHTLCSLGSSTTLEVMKFPEPVLSMSIEPRTAHDQEKLSLALHKLQDEDPSFRVEYNKETGQTIISGMGQLHLEIAVDRMLREFNVEAHLGHPQVAYKETITKRVHSAVGKFIHQSGGKGQYGHVVFRVEPVDRGTGVIFEDRTKGGVIPKEFISSVETGVMEASRTGVLAGFPVADIKVTLIDGSYHEVDSSEFAFEVAAQIGFREGVLKGNPVLLEPVMNLEIVVPEEYLSSVIGDLNSRRAKIETISQRGNVKVLRCFVPLAEMFDYANILRSSSQGRAVYTMEPAFYAEVPEEEKRKILRV